MTLFLAYARSRGAYRSGLLTGESAALTVLARRLAPAPAGQTWFGDDAAVVDPPRGPLLLAADAVVAGVHADLTLTGVDDLGWKAMAVNVSDLAAMGGRPCHALVTVALPRAVTCPPSTTACWPRPPPSGAPWWGATSPAGRCWW